jgi:hypothetical protein
MKRFSKIFIRLVIVVLILLVAFYLVLWGLSFKKYSPVFGISYDPDYALYLGLDWKQAYTNILDELKPKYLRISAPWDDIEPKINAYDYTRTDFMLSEAQKRNVKVTLVVGQKVPRWPECHIPSWTAPLSPSQRQEELLNYVQMILNRYKNNSAVEYWQVENEPFINFPFGECKLFNSESVYSEIELVRKLDPTRQIIITDSGELSSWKESARAGDVLGTTLYRSVKSVFGMTFSYDWLPAGYYRLRATIWNKPAESFFISELQAEPWFGSLSPQNISESEVDETLSVKRLAKNIEFAKKVGASRVYFWGAEWWYWLKIERNDSRYYEIGKRIFE